MTRRQASSRSPERRSGAAAAGGSALTTTSRGPSRSNVAVRCRSRRFTRLRITALPTFLDTTKPTLVAPGGLSLLRRRACTTTDGVAARDPRLTATAKSLAAFRRWARGNTSYRRVRRTAGSDPCGDDPPGWRGRRGYACGCGSRGCGYDDGCSAGTCACSWDVLPHSSSDSAACPKAGERCPTEEATCQRYVLPGSLAKLAVSRSLASSRHGGRSRRPSRNGNRTQPTPPHLRRPRIGR